MADADIVKGEQIISSPGLTPIAPIIAINPDVHEFTLIACFTLIFSEKLFRQLLSGTPRVSSVPLL